MSRIFPALCVSVLLALPALAEGQYELAKPSAQCEIASMQAADQLWEEDAEEAALIRTTRGRVERDRANLMIKIDGRYPLTFKDSFQVEGLACDQLQSVRYRLVALTDRYAILLVDGYEWHWSLVVDIATGRKAEFNANTPVLSPDQRYASLTGAPFGDLPPPVMLLDLGAQLRWVELKDYEADPDTVVWMDGQRQRLQLRKTSDAHYEAAVLSITPTGISVRVDTTGEILSAPFEAVSLQ